jgi:hypothetical protein
MDPSGDASPHPAADTSRFRSFGVKITAAAMLAVATMAVIVLRICGKRLKVMIPTLLPALEQHGRLKLGKADRDHVLAISAATIDRLLGDVKVAASGGKRRRADSPRGTGADSLTRVLRRCGRGCKGTGSSAASPAFRVQRGGLGPVDI